MKSVLLALLAAAIAAQAAAPDAAATPTAAAERARIAAGRSRVEAQFQGEERACWGRFGVNDCLGEARAKRRSALADLRRQEISLNDAERKQRAAQRLRSIEQRSPPAATPPVGAPAAVRDRDGRDAQAAQRAAGQAAREAEHARRAKAKPPAGGSARTGEELARREAERARRAEQAAANVARREALQREAGERQEALRRRLAARQKPPAAPLPAPP